MRSARRGYRIGRVVTRDRELGGVSRERRMAIRYRIWQAMASGTGVTNRPPPPGWREQRHGDRGMLALALGG
jgi:hypothetical protein